jgi:hypothetical protein
MRNETEQIPLLLSTSSTVVGPVLTVSPGVVLCYDHVDQGVAQWLRIEFVCTQAVQLRREPCRIAEDIQSSRSMQSMGNTPWLIEMLARRKDYFGIWYDPANDEKFRHYRIYFDEGGVVEAVAAGVSISGPYDEMPVRVIDRAKPESN